MHNTNSVLVRRRRQDTGHWEPFQHPMLPAEAPLPTGPTKSWSFRTVMAYGA